MTQKNAAIRNRRRIGKRLADKIDELGIDRRKMSKHTGIGMDTLDNLHRVSPHPGTIIAVAQYIENVAKERKQRG